MRNKNPLYITIALIIGLIIGSCLTSSYGSLTRIKSIPEHIKYMEKHEKGLTLKKLNARITKLETKMDKLERGK